MLNLPRASMEVRTSRGSMDSNSSASGLPNTGDPGEDHESTPEASPSDSMLIADDINLLRQYGNVNAKEHSVKQLVAYYGALTRVILASCMFLVMLIQLPCFIEGVRALIFYFFSVGECGEHCGFLPYMECFSGPHLWLLIMVTCCHVPVAINGWKESQGEDTEYPPMLGVAIGLLPIATVYSILCAVWDGSIPKGTQCTEMITAMGGMMPAMNILIAITTLIFAGVCFACWFVFERKFASMPGFVALYLVLIRVPSLVLPQKHTGRVTPELDLESVPPVEK